MVTAIRYGLFLLALVGACGGSTASRTPAEVDASTLDRTSPPTLPTCPEPYLALDVALEDGRRFEECLSLRTLTWSTNGCANEGFTASTGWTAGRVEVDTFVGWSTSRAPGTFPFLRMGEIGLGAMFQMSERQCNPPRERCDLASPGACCRFTTRGAHSCRWNVLRAGRGGALIEAELIAPCSLLEETYDGRVHTPPRTITLQRGRLRGVLQRVDPGIPLPHDGGAWTQDCGF